MSSSGRSNALSSLVFLAALAVVFVFLLRPAEAATFTVTKTADTADGTCNADCSLREAIIAANASPAADTITLPAGTYTLSIAGADNAAASGDLDITGTLTINGAGAPTTIIDGGGLDSVLDIRPLAVSIISDVTIQGGSTGPLGAGGIYSQESLTLTNVTVSGNSTTGSGGGIMNYDGALTITNSTISGNTAGGHGGGIYAWYGSLSITNSTISGNTATLSGGGVYNLSPSTASLSNVTVSGNSATGGGGGIARAGSGGAVTLKNTIVADSTSGGNCSGTITSSGNNLDSGTTCALAGSGDLSSTNPLLGPLALNPPGTTQTHAVLAGSPAIDAGANAGCPVTDQRDVARPVDGDGNGTPVCDIGAYEAPFSAPTPTPSPTPTPTPTSEPGALTQGDVDCNGNANSVDSLKVLRYVAQLSVAQGPDCPLIGTDVASFFGDVDCSGAVNSVDALKILRFVAQLSVAQTEPCADINQPL